MTKLFFYHCKNSTFVFLKEFNELDKKTNINIKHSGNNLIYGDIFDLFHKYCFTSHRKEF